MYLLKQFFVFIEILFKLRKYDRSPSKMMYNSLRRIGNDENDGKAVKALNALNEYVYISDLLTLLKLKLEMCSTNVGRQHYTYIRWSLRTCCARKKKIGLFRDIKSDLYCSRSHQMPLPDQMTKIAPQVCTYF